MKKTDGRFDRVKGSHHIIRKNGQSVAVPVHGAKDLDKGLQASLIKRLNK
ncbi:MAG: type II toxin-antitoxin system HicA family toxin [Spirochaetaceae bacterium]|nr:type II toxin-antitoxin system HicA family toxin [Spirochaetaceae bacterium]